MNNPCLVVTQAAKFWWGKEKNLGGQKMFKISMKHAIFMLKLANLAYFNTFQIIFGVRLFLVVNASNSPCGTATAVAPVNVYPAFV